MGDHDSLFERAFAEPEHASGALRSVLPSEPVAALDLAAFQIVPGSFVDARCAESFTDLLFRAPMTKSGKLAYVYLLMEHQSTAHPLMPFRVLAYQQPIWDAVLRNEPGRTTLPPIVTLVIYHGERPWNAPRRLRDRGHGNIEVSVRHLRRVVGDSAHDLVRARIAQVAPAMEERMARRWRGSASRTRRSEPGRAGRSAGPAVAGPGHTSLGSVAPCGRMTYDPDV